MRIVHDEKKNAGTGLKSHDLEVYWSIEHKYPSIENHDGMVDNRGKNSLCINVTPFE